MAAFQSCPTCQASLILCVGSIVDIGAIFDFEIGGLQNGAKIVLLYIFYHQNKKNKTVVIM